MRRPTRRSSPPSSGLSSDEIQIEEGDTDKAPYGAGTWGSRSTPVGGAAAAMAARKIRAKAQKIAAHLLEVGEGDLEWEIDRFKVKGNPAEAKTMKEIAMAAHTSNLPDGMEKGLDAYRVLRSAQHDVPVRRVRRASSTSTASPARPRCAASTRSTIAARGSTR